MEKDEISNKTANFSKISKREWLFEALLSFTWLDVLKKNNETFREAFRRNKVLFVIFSILSLSCLVDFVQTLSDPLGQILFLFLVIIPGTIWLGLAAMLYYEDKK